MPPFALVIAFTLLGGASGALAQSYREPPPEVVALLEAPQAPVAVPAPGGRHLLLLEREGMSSAEALAEATVSVAGIPLDPVTNARRNALPFVGLALVDLTTRAQRELRIPGRRFGYPVWSPEGDRYAVPVQEEDGIALWVGRPHEPASRLVPGLNAALGAPCAWMPDARRVLCRTIPSERGPPPDEPTSSLGPIILGSGRAPGRAEHGRDERSVDYYLRSQVVVLEAESGTARTLGEPAVLESVTPSPRGDHLLVTRVTGLRAGGSDLHLHRRSVEIWNASGSRIRTVHPVAPEPTVAPLVGPPRGFQWAAVPSSGPVTLVWRQTRAAGDSLIGLRAPFDGEPIELLQLGQRISGVTWLESSLRVLVRTYDPSGRGVRLELADLDDERHRLRRLRSHSIDDPRGSLGQAVSVPGSGGLIARVHDGVFFLSGKEVADGQVRTYLDRVAVDSLATDRMWVSPLGGYEVVEDLIASSGPVLLTRRETPSRPPTYFVRDLATRDALAITEVTAPGSAFRGMERVSLRYRRADQVELSSALYLPPGHRAGERLPLIMWMYPRRYAHPATETVDNVPQRFIGRSAATRLHFVLGGYAVMDDVSMPVIGSDGLGNDSFVQQVVANARAAIAAAAEQGFVDPDRVGVAGHSYGAFAVANLLVHSRLFKAGVAMNGAYNRTLTPFGFQTERRSLWNARDTYLAMSPFLYVDNLRAPLLLIHGARDDNAGTPVMQSMRFYEAIRANGGEARLVILPLEGHTYRARESVLHIAAEMREWFDLHLKGPVRDGLTPATARADAAAVP